MVSRVSTITQSSARAGRGPSPRRRRLAERPGVAAGFSLIELLMAMALTLIVTGAIFGFMTAGQTSFRREPAMSDQQQQIRVGLAAIQQDLMTAGNQLGHFTQIFTDNLNDVTAVGNPPSVIVNGEDSDHLEFRGNDGQCRSLATCQPGGGGGGGSGNYANQRTIEPLPACMNIPGLVAISDGGANGAIRWACVPGGGGNSGCAGAPAGGGGAQNGFVTFPSGSAPDGCGSDPDDSCNPVGALGWTPTQITTVNILRYEVRVDADGVPNLWRSPTGGLASQANGACAPAGLAAGGDDWQLIARGIEDLQVQYLKGNNVWADTPGAVAPGDYDSLVREVRITLSGRVMEPNLAGEMDSVQGRAIRNQLTTTVTPRAALHALQVVGRWQ